EPKPVGKEALNHLRNQVLSHKLSGNLCGDVVSNRVRPVRAARYLAIVNTISRRDQALKREIVRPEGGIVRIAVVMAIVYCRPDRSNLELRLLGCVWHLCKDEGSHSDR